MSICELPYRDRVVFDRKYQSSFLLISFFAIDYTDDGEFAAAFESRENIFSKFTMKYV